MTNGTTQNCVPDPEYFRLSNCDDVHYALCSLPRLSESFSLVHIIHAVHMYMTCYLGIYMIITHMTVLMCSNTCSIQVE